MSNKKDEILELVTPLFLQNGFKGFTVNDIADELNISKKTLYKYFGSKEGLISETKGFIELLFYRLYDSVSEQSETAVDLLHSFIATVENNFGFNQLRANLLEVKLYYAKIEDGLVDTHRKIIEGLVSRLIERASKEGLLDERVDITSVEVILGHMYIYISTIVDNVSKADYNMLFNEYIYIIAKVLFNEKGMNLLVEKGEYLR